MAGDVNKRLGFESDAKLRSATICVYLCASVVNIFAITDERRSLVRLLVLTLGGNVSNFIQGYAAKLSYLFG